MNQPQNSTDNIQIRVHQIERTAQGTEWVRNNGQKMSNNCRKLLAFWQEKRYWLNKHDCLRFVGVDCISQRSADLIHKNQIPIDKHNEPGEDCTRYRLRCTCQTIGGITQKQGCWAHDPALKVTI